MLGSDPPEVKTVTVGRLEDLRSPPIRTLPVGEPLRSVPHCSLKPNSDKGPWPRDDGRLRIEQSAEGAQRRHPHRVPERQSALQPVPFGTRESAEARRRAATVGFIHQADFYTLCRLALCVQNGDEDASIPA